MAIINNKAKNKESSVKVAIIGGAGGVGSSIAFNLLLRSEPYDIRLVDLNAKMIISHVMDLEQTVVLSAAHSIRGGDEVEICDADIIVICASVPLRLNNSRLVFLNENVFIVGHFIDRLVNKKPDWCGVIIIVTNPVDPICTWVQRRTGFDRRRILGYTLNDSLRLRTGISRLLGVPPQNIDAWIIGEHGDFGVPLYSRIKINDISIELTAEQREDVNDFVSSWYIRHVGLNSYRTTTWTTGLGVARMIASIACGKREISPASVVLAGEYDIKGVSLSVPVSLGCDGAEEIHEWEITSEEQAALQVAASNVSEATNQIIHAASL